MPRGIGVVVAFALLAAAGCSEPRAGTLPTPSPSTTRPLATTSAISSPSVEASLISAATTFYAVLERASRQPAAEAETVAQLIDPGCPCHRIVDFLRDQARLGHRIERPVRVLNPRVARGGSSGTVFLTLDQGAGAVLDSNGKVVERLAASRAAVVIDFARVGDRLLVRQLTSDAS